MDLIASKNRWLLIASLVLPVLVLTVITVNKIIIAASGVEARFPVEGYDPRDILAGHYVTYRVDYGVDNLCPQSLSVKAISSQSCLCITDVATVPATSHPVDCYDPLPAECIALIKGSCMSGSFEADIERFYINESNAAGIDQAVRRGNMMIRVKVSRNGGAVVQSLEPRDESGSK